MADITEQFYEAVRSTELGKLLADYLAERKRVPKVESRFLPDDVKARYEYNTAFGSDLPSEGVISVQPTWNKAGVSTATHELTHAAERELSEQYFSTPRADRPTSQYAQAFQKLRLGGKSGGPSVLAERLAPDWLKDNREYRASPSELTAFAAGNVSGPGGWAGPPHVDTTLAQELSILAELASRRKAK